MMDIKCHDVGSDYIEIRDGNLEDSPLIGKWCGNGSDVPAFISSTQNYFKIRLILLIKLIEMRGKAAVFTGSTLIILRLDLDSKLSMNLYSLELVHVEAALKLQMVT